MKKIFIICLIVINAGLFAKNLDKIIAKVGNEVILKSDLEKQIMQIKNMNIYNENMSESDILNSMIESKLIVQKAKEEDYQINEQNLDMKLDMQIKNIVSQFNSEQEFKEQLKNAGITLNELKKIQKKILKEKMYSEQIIEKEVKSKIYITSTEIKDYFENNKNELPNRPKMTQIGMIFREIKAGKKTKLEKLKYIQSIYRKLKQGENFEKLAKEYSDCPSGKQGGDLGFFGKGVMIPEFEKTAFDLQPGEISKIIFTQFGYHIIKVEEIKDNEIHARHILINVKASNDDRENEIALMDSINNSLKENFNLFGELAKKYSEDIESKNNNGIVGDFEEDKYPDMFKKQISNINIGQSTNVISEGNMFYIFAKLKNVESRPYKYEEIESRLRNIITQEKQKKLYKEFLDKIKNEHYVEILLND